MRTLLACAVFVLVAMLNTCARGQGRFGEPGYFPPNTEPPRVYRPGPNSGTNLYVPAPFPPRYIPPFGGGNMPMPNYLPPPDYYRAYRDCRDYGFCGGRR